ncbi:MAG: HigA family addiction module antidote protein [Bacteroidales bacterium]|nr:HigA family addiction module antidote protein [Bacteroidales bacterium]
MNDKFELTDNIIPGKATHPGVLLKQELEYKQISVKEFAINSQISENSIKKIINGKEYITIDIALKLETILNIDTDFWLQLQYNYEKDLLKIKKKTEIEKSNLPKNIQKRILTSMNLL